MNDLIQFDPEVHKPPITGFIERTTQVGPDMWSDTQEEVIIWSSHKETSLISRGLSEAKPISNSILRVRNTTTNTVLDL